MPRCFIKGERGVFKGFPGVSKGLSWGGVSGNTCYWPDQGYCHCPVIKCQKAA